MRLALKLSVIVVIFLGVLLCGIGWRVWIDHGSRVKKRDDAVLRNSVLAVAGTCRHHCLQSTGVSSPRAFRGAFWVNHEGLVVADTIGGERLSALPGGTGAIHWAQSAAAGEKIVSGIIESDSGERLRVIGAPGEGGAVIAYFSESELIRSRAWFDRLWRKRMIQFALAAIAGGILLSLLLAKLLLGPVRRIEEAARRVADGDFTARVSLNQDDEFGELGKRFDAMTNRLAELDALKDQFLSKVSHDLKNPLSTILSKVDMLLGGYKGPLNDKQKEALGSVEGSVHRLDEIVGAMLDVARIDAGRKKFEPEDLDLKEEIDLIGRDAALRAKQMGISFTVSVPPEGGIIRFDPTAFRKIVAILLENAFQFTASGGSVSLNVSRRSGGKCLIVVSDTGLGFDEQHAKRIFEKFYQVPENKGKVRPVTGSGLGLYIAKSFVESHGGRLEADSAAMRGSTFTVSLPSGMAT